MKDFESRPSVTELLNHPFIADIGLDQEYLQNKLRDLVEQQRNDDELDLSMASNKFDSKRNRYRSQNTTHDLATLEQFNEDTIVSQLLNRFEQEQIYTYIGDILIAINPFTELNIYNEQVNF